MVLDFCLLFINQPHPLITLSTHVSQKAIQGRKEDKTTILQDHDFYQFFFFLSFFLFFSFSGMMDLRGRTSGLLRCLLLGGILAIIYLLFLRPAPPRGSATLCSDT